MVAGPLAMVRILLLLSLSLSLEVEDSAGVVGRCYLKRKTVSKLVVAHVQMSAASFWSFRSRVASGSCFVVSTTKDSNGRCPKFRSSLEWRGPIFLVSLTFAGVNRWCQYFPKHIQRWKRRV